MQRTRMSALLMTLAVLLLALAPAASAQPLGPSRVLLPLVFAPGSAPQPSALFWSERYTLPTGGCATLHWKTQGAYEVYLDGARVGAQGTQQACPTANQFYTLEVLIGGPVGAAPGGTIVIYREVFLSAGEPVLRANEVIAQGTISAIAPAADVDPKADGDQPGYRLDLKNVNKLWAYNPGWNQATVSVNVPQEAIDLGEQGPVHWPLRVGQGVEFFAECDGAACLVDYMSWHYLYMTTE